MLVLLAASAAGAAEAPTSSSPPTTAATGTLVNGVLTVGGRPVAGVQMTISKGTTQVARSTSNAKGEWSLAVPGPGIYRIKLDTSTLPKGIEAKRFELPNFRVFGTFTQHAVFKLTRANEKESTGPSRFDRFSNLFVSGIRFGLIVGLCSVGLSIIYGTTGLVNFAHGELVTFGALIAWFFNTMSSGPRLSLFLAAAIAVLASGLLGARARSRGVAADGAETLRCDRAHARVDRPRPLPAVHLPDGLQREPAFVPAVFGAVADPARTVALPAARLRDHGRVRW